MWRERRKLETTDKARDFDLSRPKFRARVCVSSSPQSPSPKLETTRSLLAAWLGLIYCDFRQFFSPRTVFDTTKMQRINWKSWEAGAILKFILSQTGQNWYRLLVLSFFTRFILINNQYSGWWITLGKMTKMFAFYKVKCKKEYLETQTLTAVSEPPTPPHKITNVKYCIFPCCLYLKFSFCFTTCLYASYFPQSQRQVHIGYKCFVHECYCVNRMWTSLRVKANCESCAQ